MTKQETDNYIKIGLVLVAVIVLFIILNKAGKGIEGFLETLGLKSTEEQKKTEAAQEKITQKAESAAPAVNAWGTQLWGNVEKAPAGSKFFKGATANAKAISIYKSIGRKWYTPDDAEQIEMVIKTCPSKLAVSQLVTAYAKLYRKDMYSDIKNVLYTEEKGRAIPGDWTPTKQKQSWERILTFVENLPTY